MKITTQFAMANNKKYPYSLKVGKKWTYVECKAAKISQKFLTEDIPALLVDLPELIIGQQEYEKKQSHVLRFRCNEEERREIEKRAVQKRFPNISAYLRALALSGELKFPIKTTKAQKAFTGA